MRLGATPETGKHGSWWTQRHAAQNGNVDGSGKHRVMRNPIARLLGFSTQDAASPMAGEHDLAKATWEHLLDADVPSTATRTDAMSIAAVAKGRQLITGAIARLPLVAMTGNEISDPQPPLLQQLETSRPRVQTLTWIIDHLIFFGVAWLVVTKRYAEAPGRPMHVAWVPQWYASTNNRGELIKAFGIPVAQADVIRIDGPHEGILNFASERIQAARQLDKAALLASTNPVPSLELHQTSGTPLSAEEAKEFIQSYVASRAKSGVSYTSSSIETKTHGTHVEHLLIDGRKAAALDLARAMCLPAWALDAPAEGQSMTYTNVPSRARELIDYSLAPYMEAITARLSMDDILPRGQWCRFDTDPLLADDFAGRMNAYKTALETGIYTVDDLKARELGIPLEK